MGTWPKHVASSSTGVFPPCPPASAPCTQEWSLEARLTISSSWFWICLWTSAIWKRTSPEGAGPQERKSSTQIVGCSSPWPWGCRRSCQQSCPGKPRYLRQRGWVGGAEAGEWLLRGNEILGQGTLTSNARMPGISRVTSNICTEADAPGREKRQGQLCAPAPPGQAG